MSETLYNALIGHILELFFAVATVAVLYGIRYIKAKLTDRQQALLTEIARQVVLYVQQTMPKADADEKLAEAISQAIAFADEKGITVDAGQVRVIIEANIKDLKAQFGDAWNDKPPDQ